MTILERADPGRSRGGVDADAAGTATTGFEIPPNFVPPPPPREVGKFLPIPLTSHFAHLPISARSPAPPPSHAPPPYRHGISLSLSHLSSLCLSHPPPPPPSNAKATGVANLGNTCYMNATLQALAHAPELCHALDAECHLRRCPVALRNERRRRRHARELVRASSAASSPDGGGDADADAKGHRRSQSAGSDGSSGSGGSSESSSKRRRKGGLSCVDGGAGGADSLPDYEFCTLCELERLLGRVHSRPEEALDGDDAAADDDDCRDAFRAPPPDGGGDCAATARDGPFVPEAFVSGFMSKVAPWFRRGVQEDSHEFLRLLIDAMQTSCKGARAASADRGPSSSSSSKRVNNAGEDEEYPFRLFRGTVESNVTCSACRSTSTKIDPIEDIGLDILPVRSSSEGNPPQAGLSRGGGGASMSASRSTSPTTNMPLADVTQALERFISSEHLDSGYKCERCGKLGKATKTSKLASIPPILTLHLKRFRYGSGKKAGGGGGAYYQSENGGGSTSGTRSSGRSARGSVPQAADYEGSNVGPSGSAKIEGHVGFGPVLDIKPYLTPQLQQTVFQRAICRLFAVVVHSGKNSHSGHYVAYVHNVTKKEWWMMDDAKVVRSSWDEVRNAEAYMLFYRVTSHPVAMQLKSIADRKEDRARRVMEEIRRREDAARAAVEAKKAEAINAARAAAVTLQDLVEKKTPDAMTVAAPSPSDAEDPTAGGVPLGKRQRPAVASGEEWARLATTLSPDYLPLFTRIQEFIAENVTFSPEFFSYITEEYNRMNSKLSIARRVRNNKRMKTLLGRGPGGVYPPEDVIGGAVDIQGGILDLFHQVSIMFKNTNKGSGGGMESFLLPKIDSGMATPTSADVAAKEGEKPASKVTSVTTEFVPASPELIIPQDNVESYDGAL